MPTDRQSASVITQAEPSRVPPDTSSGGSGDGAPPAKRTARTRDIRAIRRYRRLFLLPGLITLALIIIFPLLFTLRVSFSGWDSTQPFLDWVGADNYTRLLGDSRYRSAMLRLAYLAVATVLLQYVLGFALALMVWREIKARRLFRVLFLIPMMTTPVIMSIIWRTIFNESLGPANDVIGLFGFGPVGWLTTERGGVASIVIAEVWQWTPFMFLIMLAGLVSLPREPFMAAAIDGAGPIRTFFKVTFPLLGPISAGALIIRLIEASKILDTVYVLTSGGPGSATETPTFYIYIRGLRDFETGYAAALSLTYLVIMIITLTLVAKALVRALRPRGL